MSSSIDDAISHLSRSETIISDFDIQVERYLQEFVSIERNWKLWQFDVRWFYTLRIKKEFPDDLRHMVAESMGHLVSACDLLINRLVTMYGLKTKNRNDYYPVCKSQEDFDSWAGKYRILFSKDQRIEPAIAGSQPYHPFESSEGISGSGINHPFYIVKQLRNLATHDLIIKASASNQTCFISVPRGYKGRIGQMRCTAGIAQRDGDEIMYITLPYHADPKVLERKLEAYAAISKDMDFGSGMNIVKLVRSAQEFVSTHVIGKLIPLLSDLEK